MARNSLALYALYLRNKETEDFVELNSLEGGIDLYTLLVHPG